MNTAYKLDKRFIELYPAMQYPYLNMGKYYSQVNKDDSAVIYFEKAIELGSRNADLLKQMAVYHDKKKDTAKVKYYLDLLKKSNI